MRNKRVWRSCNLLETFSFILCFHPMCSGSMSSVTTVSGSDVKILKYQPSEVRSMFIIIAIVLDIDWCIHLENSYIYFLCTSFKLECGHYNYCVLVFCRHLPLNIQHFSKSHNPQFVIIQPVSHNPVASFFLPHLVYYWVNFHCPYN